MFIIIIIIIIIIITIVIIIIIIIIIIKTWTQCASTDPLRIGLRADLQTLNRQRSVICLKGERKENIAASLTVCITCVTIICLYSKIVHYKCIASNS